MMLNRVLVKVRLSLCPGGARCAVGGSNLQWAIVRAFILVLRLFTSSRLDFQILPASRSHCRCILLPGLYTTGSSPTNE